MFHNVISQKCDAPTTVQRLGFVWGLLRLTYQLTVIYLMTLNVRTQMLVALFIQPTAHFLAFLCQSWMKLLSLSLWPRNAVPCHTKNTFYKIFKSIFNWKIYFEHENCFQCCQVSVVLPVLQGIVSGTCSARANETICSVFPVRKLFGSKR